MTQCQVCYRRQFMILVPVRPIRTLHFETLTERLDDRPTGSRSSSKQTLDFEYIRETCLPDTESKAQNEIACQNRSQRANLIRPTDSKKRVKKWERRKTTPFTYSQLGAFPGEANCRRLSARAPPGTAAARGYMSVGDGGPRWMVDYHIEDTKFTRTFLSFGASPHSPRA